MWLTDIHHIIEKSPLNKDMRIGSTNRMAFRVIIQLCLPKGILSCFSIEVHNASEVLLICNFC